MTGEQRDEAFREYREATKALQRYGRVPSATFDVVAARATFLAQEAATVSGFFEEIPLIGTALETLVRESAAHRPPFKSRTDSKSADKSFRDSLIQLSIVADFAASGADVGLVVSADGSFTDEVAKDFLSDARLSVVKNVAEVFTWLNTHVASWLSEQQRSEQQLVAAAVRRRADDLNALVQKNLKVPSTIASPGLLRGIDDIRVEKIRNIVADLFAPNLGRNEAEFVVDVEVAVDILEQPAVWRPTPSVGVGETVAPAGFRSLYAADYRERSVKAFAWVSGRYTRSGNDITAIDFDAVNFGSWDTSLEDLLAQRMVRDHYVSSEEDQS